MNVGEKIILEQKLDDIIIEIHNLKNDPLISHKVSLELKAKLEKVQDYRDKLQAESIIKRLDRFYAEYDRIVEVCEKL